MNHGAGFYEKGLLDPPIHTRILLSPSLSLSRSLARSLCIAFTRTGEHHDGEEEEEEEGEITNICNPTGKSPELRDPDLQHWSYRVHGQDRWHRFRTWDSSQKAGAMFTPTIADWQDISQGVIRGYSSHNRGIHGRRRLARRPSRLLISGTTWPHQGLTSRRLSALSGSRFARPNTWCGRIRPGASGTVVACAVAGRYFRAGSYLRWVGGQQPGSRDACCTSLRSRPIRHQRHAVTQAPPGRVFCLVCCIGYLPPSYHPIVVESKEGMEESRPINNIPSQPGS